MSGRGSLEFVREDDFVEYFIFPQLTDEADDSEKAQRDLENVLQKVESIVSEVSRDYIWHKDEFRLTARTDRQQVLIQANGENSGSYSYFAIFLALLMNGILQRRYHRTCTAYHTTATTSRTSGTSFICCSRSRGGRLTSLSGWSMQTASSY